MTLGDIFQVVPFIGLLAGLPILVILVTLLVRKKYSVLKTFLPILFFTYLMGFVLTRLFAGGPYQAAKHIGLYVPWWSQTLENTSGTGGFPIDEEWQYTVVRLNEKQSSTLVRELEADSKWTKQTVVPTSLLQNGTMPTSIKNPFPISKTNGFVYTQETRIPRKYDYWTKTVVSFFDPTTRNLYVYYDYGQWG